MYVTLPNTQNSAEISLDLQVEAMGYGPQAVYVYTAPAGAVQEVSPAQNAVHSWPDVAALVEFVSNIPWLLAEAPAT